MVGLHRSYVFMGRFAFGVLRSARQLSLLNRDHRRPARNRRQVAETQRTTSSGPARSCTRASRAVETETQRYRCRHWRSLRSSAGSVQRQLARVTQIAHRRSTAGLWPTKPFASVFDLFGTPLRLVREHVVIRQSNGDVQRFSKSQAVLSSLPQPAAAQGEIGALRLAAHRPRQWRRAVSAW